MSRDIKHIKKSFKLVMEYLMTWKYTFKIYNIKNLNSRIYYFRERNLNVDKISFKHSCRTEKSARE